MVGRQVATRCVCLVVRREGPKFEDTRGRFVSLFEGVSAAAVAAE